MNRSIVALAFLVGLAVFPLFALGYFYFGFAPVATRSAPIPLEGFLANKALHARIAREAPAEPVTKPTETDYVSGARIYREQCAICHGLPGREQTIIAKGMFPKPPHLFKGKGVTDDPAGETYWKVSNGIRLTGMPAFSGSLSDAQMWQVSELLANAHSLPASAQAELARPE